MARKKDNNGEWILSPGGKHILKSAKIRSLFSQENSK